MIMTEQVTSPETVAAETDIVRALVGLATTEQVDFIDVGWDSRVYSVRGGEYYVKFPRSEKIRGRYTGQIAATRLAAKLGTDVSVPEIIWEHPEHAYFGYRGVPGQQLRDIVPTLGYDEKRAVGQVLGNFLEAYHAQSLAGVRDLSPKAEVAQLQDWYARGLPESMKYFNEQERARLADLVAREWPLALNSISADPVLSHGDFHFSNILYDNGRVGIIDFGDICYADRSKDFTDFDDKIIFEAALEAYGHMSPAMRRAIDLREHMTRVITLTAQLAKHDNEGAEETALKIKTFLAGD